jgi:hypothetical protein
MKLVWFVTDITEFSGIHNTLDLTRLALENLQNMDTEEDDSHQEGDAHPLYHLPLH